MTIEAIKRADANYRANPCPTTLAACDAVREAYAQSLESRPQGDETPKKEDETA